MGVQGIRVEEIGKTFGKVTALDGVTFDVPPGTVTALLGPNGAGKTTLVHCLSTLLVPDRGTAVVDGHDVRTDPAGVRSSLALTGQFAAVDEVLTGRANLMLFARLLRLPRARAKARVGELLDRFGLSDAADASVGSYSGGMRRRLDLAASLIVERPVLVLDEPTTGLDPRTRGDLWNVVRERRDAGTTVLLTTQYLEEADRLADRVVVVDRGGLVAEGSPEQLKARVGGSVCEVRVPPEDRGRARELLRSEAAGVQEEDGALIVPAPDAGTVARLARALDGAGIEPEVLSLRRPTLDEVFLHLTGNPPEDAQASTGGPARDAEAPAGGTGEGSR
uniref:ATP-binding cassette domain-containing protein n=1 Tax=Nocardiopsis dassonvillei TaxID=2014 RepID=UPI0022B75CE8|nr:ATP-binding cassette domain-containing protein [Nocardiopsis dassonvillei]